MQQVHVLLIVGKTQRAVCSVLNEVPKFLEEAGESLKALGKVSYVVKDITGCFCAMPQQSIRHAMRRIASQIKARHG